MQENIWDAVVVGAGPAGLAAALMLGRARRRVLVIDAGDGRNRFAEHMHGVLGQEGVPPAELRERGRSEVARYGVELLADSVQRVEREQGGLRVVIADGTSQFTRTLVVATGLSDELPDVPGLAERWGATVLHCPYCHGWEVRDQHLGVLTTSPLGLHQAELIRQWSDRVTVFTHGLGALTPEAEQRLQARGIRLEPAQAIEILGEGTAIAAVLVDDGREVAVDALFTVGAPRPHDDFLASLGLERTETPFGSFLATDPMGRTSDERIWATGNVTNPAANVPLSIGTGSFAGAAVNAALVTWDFDAAVHDPAAWPQIAPVDYWEDRYTGSERVWSGRVNSVLEDVAASLTPGRALDLGCGEGADVIWLAQHGWEATGIDISATAIRRATDAARAAGLDDARFLVGDLSSLTDEDYDLVTASFLHSPVALARDDILRRAADRVVPGGHLLITSHADFPAGAEVPHGHEHRFLNPEEELAQLALDPKEWEVVFAQTRPRQTTLPDARPAEINDVVVQLRRR